MGLFENVAFQIGMLVVIIFIVLFVVARKVYEQKLRTAIRKNDMVGYGKLLNSFLAIILLEPNRVNLLRAIYSLDMNDSKQADLNLAKVNFRRLKGNEKGLYVQTASTVAMNNKDKKLFAQIKTVIDELEKTSDDKLMVKQLQQEYSVNKKLYFGFDKTVIEDLNQIIADCDSEMTKGMMSISLAKAYHLNKQDDMAKKTLNNAKAYVKGTSYEKVINDISKNLKSLD
ncbi:MAG: hypothetical protein ACI4WG_00575 [Erysipelotrichaceae bacterium]